MAGYDDEHYVRAGIQEAWPQCVGRSCPSMGGEGDQDTMIAEVPGAGEVRVINAVPSFYGHDYGNRSRQPI